MKVHVGWSEEQIAAIGAANDGIVTVAAASAAGVSKSTIESLRRRGLLRKVGRGVDRLRDHPVSWRSRCRATLALAGDDGVVGLRSAARFHCYYSYRNVPAVEVLVRRGGDHRTPEGRLVETRWLPPEHVTVVDGFPCTTVARTFFDLCGDPDYGLPVAHPAHRRAMTRVYNDALARRGMTFTQEAAVLLVLAKRGRSGTQLVRELLQEFGPKYVPTHSEAESLFMELVHAYGLPEPERQVVMSDERGFIGVVDCYWPAVDVIVEVDSAWHDGPLDEIVDQDRDARLEAIGYDVHRYHYGELISRPAAIARELAAILS